MILFRVFSMFLFLLAVHRAAAYPTYISYGYHSCMSCHFDPLGNGPLTDYGRSVSATELTDRRFWSSGIRGDDEKIAGLSGFFFGKPPVDWLRPSASYRGLAYQTNPGQAGGKTRWITMDASAALVAKFLTDDRLIFVGQLSYAPQPLAEQGSGRAYANYRSRDLYAGFRFTKSFGIYAGLMDKAFGIRVPDHIAFSRTITRNTQDDQTEALLLHYLSSTFEMALQPFIGNPVQEGNLRQKGVASQVGVLVADTTRLGASALVSSSDAMKISMYALDIRSGFDRGNSLMLEAGQVDLSPTDGTKSSNRYVFLQNQWLLNQGLSALMTAEFLQPDINQDAQTYRFGPGIQYFPIYRVELRLDVYDTRTHSSLAYADDTWFITGQVHLWF
ncbi:MAG: hypothetical protein C5B49_08835 [Bdellovibrio sp.]|nr:MAG: hypothetical protein C5B49_08835 [Bdellovibrio sp.]